jgi:uroporphyrinogen III methyltransferase/synthase
VHVVTGHRRKDHTYDIDFAALAEAGGTIVFLMGISSLPVLMNGLMGGGIDPETPAAVIENGTTAAQRIISSTVEGLAEAAKKAKVVMPAIIVVGEVAALSEDFSWLEDLPLAGVRAVVTRPRELSSGLAKMLREKGAEAIELPTIRIEAAEENPVIDEAIKGLRKSGYEWVVFTSPSGVRVFMDRLMEKYDIRILAYCSIAAIGKGTERELLKYGIRPDMVPTVYDGRTLGAQLAVLLRKGDRVLIPRASLGNPELVEELSRVRGVHIDDVTTYDTKYVTQEWFDADTEFDDPHTFALFTSASTVRGFVNAYKGMNFRKVRAVCIGKQTAAEAKRCGMGVCVSDKATLESLCAKLEEVSKAVK